MPIHARLSPSDASRWGACALAPHLDDLHRDPETGDMPDDSGEAARLGTAAHEWAEQELKDLFGIANLRPQPDLPEPFLTYARDYVARVVECVGKYRPDEIDWNVETRFDLWYEPGSQGTVDFWYVHKPTQTLYVRDLKTGRVRVSPEENPQLIIYALAAYDELSKFNTIREVQLEIDQPSVRKTIKAKSYYVDELELFRKEINASVAAVQRPLFGIRGTPGSPQCDWCRHVAACPAATTELDKDMTEFLDSHTVETASLEQVAKIHAKAKQYQGVLDAIDDRLREDPDREKVGWKLIRGGRRFSWFDKKAAAAALEEFGIAPYAEPELKSVAAVRKELGEDREEIILDMVRTNFNKPSLVVSDDPRPALEDEGN